MQLDGQQTMYKIKSELQKDSVQIASAAQLGRQDGVGSVDGGEERTRRDNN